MEVKQFKIETSDAIERVGYFWKSDISPSIGNVVISHGMCEFAMRYDDFAKFLNQNGYDVYALDQVGHGENAPDGLGVWEDDTFKQCVKNLHTIMQQLRATSKPTYLIGHSMGSFICQYYFEKYSRELHIKKAVLIGTSGPRKIYHLASFIANVHAKFHKLNKPSKFLNKLSFGSFNNKIDKKDRRTPYDWVCGNNDIIDAYAADPRCTFIPSIGFYKSFYNALTRVHLKKRLECIPKDLPILIMGGSEDPVCQYGKGLHNLQSLYAKYGITSMVKEYPNMRHEILNEKDHEIVYQEILEFLKETA